MIQNRKKISKILWIRISFQLVCGVTGQAKLLPTTGLPACGRKKQVISSDQRVTNEPTCFHQELLWQLRHRPTFPSFPLPFFCSPLTVENSDAHVFFFFFFYKICTAGGKNNESIISPMMAFLAGTPKKQSNCQLLVAWGLLPVFIFPGAHDTFQTFQWHDRHDKVGPFFIWNQYFKSLHMLHNWGSQLCSVTQRRCVYEARWNTKRKTKTGKNCKGIHDKQVWIQLFSLNQNIWAMEINSLDEQQPTQ